MIKIKVRPFSKKLLIADYIIAVALVIGFFICIAINGIYSKQVMDEMIKTGIDLSYVTVPVLFPLDNFGILLGTWIAQLGISSGAYYVLIKSEHKIQLPIKLIEELPDDIKQSVDMTQVITTVLNTSDN